MINVAKITHNASVASCVGSPPKELAGGACDVRFSICNYSSCYDKSFNSFSIKGTKDWTSRYREKNPWSSFQISINLKPRNINSY